MQTKTQGCGCGGRAGGCGCSGSSSSTAPAQAAAAPCSPCETAAFVRPRFFAGQLLTEDDLGALVDYTLAKQRFHNTHLLGAGVVNGLLVACGPCDSSQVVVEAGYAIDGCGNDLVLTCAKTLDLAPMIRELQARQRGGVDCGDPCPPAASQASPAASKAPPAAPRPYSLYARYTERADQPVAAYPLGDDCDTAGAPSCEPTRILEGVTFELRCPPLAAAAGTLRDRLAACPDASGLSHDVVERAIVYARYQRQLARALASRDTALAAGALDADEIADLRDGSVELESLLAGHSPAERLVAMGQYLTRVGGPFARMLRGKVAAPQGVSPEQITQNLTRATDAISLADPELVAHASERTLITEAARLWQEAGEPVRGATSPEIQLYLHGAVATSATAKVLAAEIAALAAKLGAAGCRDDVHADCALRALFDTLAPRWGAAGDPANELAALSAQLAASVEVIRRLTEDCRCAAINPPPAASDDAAVLLATIEVDRCKVVRICNTVRPYVLAPATLRYWDAIQRPDANGCAKAGDPAPDPAAMASELAALRRNQAALERRLGELEQAARTPQAPQAPQAEKAKAPQ